MTVTEFGDLPQKIQRLLVGWTRESVRRAADEELLEIKGMGPKKLQILRGAIPQARDETVLQPQPGPQTEFLSTSADICGYGGAAGGGKTFACLLETLRHIHNSGFRAVFFRRTYIQIKAEGGLWDEACAMYQPLGIRMNHSDLAAIAPSGARVKFAHLQHEKTKLEHQGAQYALMIFDELTHFTETQFTYLLSRVRSVSGVRPYIRATCNPDASSWVKKFFAPWLDKNSPIKAESGELLWMVRSGGECKFFPITDPKPPDALSVTFIKSTVFDNKILLEKDPGYVAKLKALNAVDRARLLDGNWDIKEGEQKYNPDWFKIVRRHELKNMEVVARLRYWDMAGTEKDEDKGACYTAGVRMAKLASGEFVIEDIKRVQYRPGDVEKLVWKTAQRDGKDVEVWMEQEPGSAGKTVIEHYRKLLAGWIFMGDRPTGDKLTRSRPLETQAEFGNIWVAEAPWNRAFISEAEEYPHGHKDQIDAAAGALQALTNAGGFAFA